MNMLELGMALGLAGVAAVGVASLMGSMSGSTKDAEMVIEKTKFASSLGVFLNSNGGCKALQGSVPPGTESEYQLVPYTDEAGRPKEFDFEGFKGIRSDTPLRYNTVRSLRAQMVEVPGIAPINLDDGKILKKAVITVKLVVTKKSGELNPAQRFAAEAKFPQSKYEYSIPVMMDQASRAIQFCGDGTSLAEACSALKGEFSVADGQCKLPKTCESFGSYAIINCAPKFASVSCNDTSRGTPFPNPVTGAYSCPLGSSAISTGGQSWFRNIDCGKKCQARVNFSIGYFSCLKCE